ncbi:MAG: glycine oxidase ThiO [Proteobacteria bacterium]|nr:glycine oxidase ThiO [Pseudomonadota bacterium]
MTDSINSADCVVVGGGLLGLLTAWRLAQEGIKVTLLERGALCSESSWAGGGILSPLLPWQYADAVSRLAEWSQRQYPLLAAELQEQTGVDPEWTRSGMLLLDTVPDARVTAWTERFRCRLEVLDAGQVQRVEPALAAASVPAVLLPDVAQIRNPRLCRSLAISLQMQGVRVREQCAATRLLVRDQVVEGIETVAGTVHTGCVVIAGGAWSPQLLEGVGHRELPVKPVRGQMILFQARPGLLRHIVQGEGYYLIPRRDGLVLAGSTLEHTGYSKETTPQAREQLMKAALRIAPGLAEYPVIRQWAGLRPGSPEGIPFIGEHSETRGLYLNTGHFRNGVVMAPASARLLVDGLLKRDSFTDSAPYVF